MAVQQFKYQNHWPIWCIMDGDKVIQCFMTEQEAVAAAQVMSA